MSIPLNIAATAAWRVDTAPRFISEIFAALNDDHVATIRAAWSILIVVSNPCLARGRVKNNFIAWVNPHTCARVDPFVFCNHSFLHNLPFVD